MNRVITDASEFSQTSVPQLVQLDTLLRCHICKDFLKTPVLTPCGHSFCSLCIRGYLTKEPKCPLCLTELRESSLRSEFLVNEIVESYNSSRKQLLENLKDTSPKPDGPRIDIGSDSDIDDDLQIVATNQKLVTKRQNPGPFKVTKSVNKTNSTLGFQNKRFKTTESLAQCPICQDSFPLQVLERTHLDECLTLQSLQVPPKQATSLKDSSISRTSNVVDKKQKIMTQTDNEVSHVSRYLFSSNDGHAQRLPKTNFTSMSVAQIKQKLLSLGLPTSGSRQNMMARYNHYEMLWNSNFCDALAPVTEVELKRQLASWEASQKISNIPSSNGYSISSLMKRSGNNVSYQKLLMDFKSDKFDRKSWINMFGKEFSILVKEAKKSIVATAQDGKTPKTVTKEDT